MANHVKDLATDGLTKLGIQASGNSGATLDLKDLPAPVADVMRAAYGDATAGIFMISAAVSVVALLAVLFIKEKPLRRTVDITPEAALQANAAGEAGITAMTGQLPRVSVAVPGKDTRSAVGSGSASSGSAGGKAYDGGTSAVPTAGSAVLTADDLEEAFALNFEADQARRGTGLEDPRSADNAGASGRGFAARATATAATSAAATAAATAAETVQKLQDTQHLLARQQVELGKLVLDIQEQLRSQREVAAQQAATAAELSRLKRRLLKERKSQAAAALYIASHGKHSAAAPQD
jgi:hypothetical protein